MESPIGPTWYAATMAPVRERGPLTHDLDVDVCVVGAGLAGLTVAREIARRGWSVAVLEARCVGWSASGRNAGFVSPGFAERIDAIVERVGLPRAKELWTLSQAGADYVRRTIDETGMPGVEAKDGRLAVRRTDDEDAVIRHTAMLRVDFGAEVEAWPTEQVREVLRSGVYFQGVHFPAAFHIHALNYLQGLGVAAEAAGARIFEQTAAIELDPAGVRKRIATEHARVRAAHVVLAGSAHLGAMNRAVADTVLPVATYMAVTAPLGEKLFDAVRYNGAIADTRRTGDYYRIVDDDRLMWGGRISVRASEPRRLRQMMRGDILAVYPQLGEVEIEYAWSGLMGYALHKMPQIGELSPGYWLASAFGGHGLNTTAMAGDLIARAIVEGDDRWRLFSAYDLVWAGGRFGRAAARAMIWSMQAREALKEKIARYRDRARREAEERQAKWAAEKAARKAEEEQRRAQEEARRLAEEAARRAQEEAGRRAAEAARKAEEEAARVAAEKAVQDAVDAAFALPKQVEQYKPAAIVEAAADAPPLAGTAPVGEPHAGVAKAEVATVEPAAAEAVVAASAEAEAAVTAIMAEPVPPVPAKPAGKRRSRGRKKKE